MWWNASGVNTLYSSGYHESFVGDVGIFSVMMGFIGIFGEVLFD